MPCCRSLTTRPNGCGGIWTRARSLLTFLHASAPRVACPEHGVRQVRLPWAEPHSRFTALFERLAINVLGACDVAAAAKLLRISWDEAWRLMDRAVARGLAAKPPRGPPMSGSMRKRPGKDTTTSPTLPSRSPPRSQNNQPHHIPNPQLSPGIHSCQLP
jgi:hypothetical protein